MFAGKFASDFEENALPECSRECENYINTNQELI